MKTTIPKNSGPDYGLLFTQGGYRASFTRNGKRHYRVLKTTDLATARERRDALYAALTAAGATPPDNRMDVKPDDDGGIYKTKPRWTVKIHGHHVGSYATKAQARAAKLEYLKTI